MTHEQMFSLYLPLLTPLFTVAAVMIGFLYNNARLTDLRGGINDMRDMLRAEISKNQSELLHKFAELDQRLVRLEGTRR